MKLHSLILCSLGSLLCALPWNLGAKDLVPLSIPRPGLPLLVEGTVCDSPGLIAIDTGSSFSSVSHGFESKLQKLTSRKLREGDGRVGESQLFSGATLSFGTYLANDPAYLMDFSQVQMVLGENVTGLLGSSYLANKQIWVHQSAGKLQISENPIPQVTDLEHRGITLQVTIEHQAPHVEASFGKESVSCLIDSGSDGALTLQESTFDRLVDEGKIAVKGSIRVAVGDGATLVPYGRLDHFTFCNFTFENLVVTRKPNSSSIGLQILSRFIWAIDYPRQKAYFLLDPNFKPLFDLDNGLGAFLVYLPDGTAKIIQIVKDTPAAGSGLKEGDIIQQLGDLPTGSFSKKAVMQLLAANAGKEITARYLRQNEPREATLSIPK
ncbi:MAG: PDZ domain-containing protein [Verrucomicrobiae bacterium]|nr:PDZ domain-containing protein [Verrucomicrobiae bacterium]